MKGRFLAVGTAALLVLLALVVSFVADRGTSALVRDADGEIVARYPLSDSGEFGIEYVHSYYKVPVIEHFSTGPREGFELVRISSSSEAALDYYELEGRKEVADGGWIRLVPEKPPRFGELPLVGTATGQRTLVLPDHELPLFTESGAPVHLTLQVEEDGPLTEVREVLS